MDTYVLNQDLLPPVPPPVNWVGSVLQAAIWSIDPSLPGASAPAAASLALDGAKATIVIMVDGLGQIPLAENLSYARTLRSLSKGQFSGQSCVPSTTAAALTAFTTGELPAATNMVGYSVRHGDGVMNLLNFAEGVSGARWQPVPTLMERLSSVAVETSLITSERFRASGLTAAAFRGATFVGRDQLGDRMDAAIAGTRKGVPLQIVYWSDIDHAGHQHGVHSARWTQALEEFDSALASFLSRVPPGTQVLMTADHGMVDVEDVIDVAKTPSLRQDTKVVAGEGRAAHIHALSGTAAQVIARWRDYLGDRAWVVPREELAHLMGEGAGLDLVGDAVAFLRDRSVVMDSRTVSPAALLQKGVHGSLTPEEMLIPIWRLC